MTHDTASNTDPLEEMFRTARTTPEPSPDFMARILSDALAAQPVAAQPLAAGAVVRRPRNLWSRAFSSLGGGLGLAGLTTAAMAGLVIGYAQPDPLLSLGEDLGLSAEMASLDLSSGFDALLSEETLQ